MKNVRWVFNTKVDVYGPQEEIDQALDVMNKTTGLETVDEAVFRIKMQFLIDHFNLKATIMYDGNQVWSKKRVIRDLRLVINKDSTEVMTDYLYRFFHLCCGTIAHYDKAGWSATYPDTASLRRLFRRNEYGMVVREGIPTWKTDVQSIVMDIEFMLGI